MEYGIPLLEEKAGIIILHVVTNGATHKHGTDVGF